MDVTRILTKIEEGDLQAADDLLPLVYDELRRLAAQKLSRERAGHTLQPTALVHEAWLRLVADDDHCGWKSRGHFYGAAAEAMRRILIDAARRKASIKRGGDRHQIDLPANELPAVNQNGDQDWVALLDLNDALTKLQEYDLDAYQIVMLRFFGGLTLKQAAQSLGVSTRTAIRNWKFAQAWLQREIDGQANHEDS